MLCANCHREIHAGIISIEDISQIFLKDKAAYYSQLVEQTKHRQVFYCKDCGKEITRPKVGKLEYRCIECAAKNARKVERPDRLTLKQLVRDNPMIKVGKMFNVTDNTIRKWLKSENLPTKKREIDSYSDAEWNKL